MSLFNMLGSFLVLLISGSLASCRAVDSDTFRNQSGTIHSRSLLTDPACMSGQPTMPTYWKDMSGLLGPLFGHEDVLRMSNDGPKHRSPMVPTQPFEPVKYQHHMPFSASSGLVELLFSAGPDLPKSDAIYTVHSNTMKEALSRIQHKCWNQGGHIPNAVILIHHNPSIMLQTRRRDDPPLGPARLPASSDPSPYLSALLRFNTGSWHRPDRGFISSPADLEKAKNDGKPQAECKSRFSAFNTMEKRASAVELLAELKTQAGSQSGEHPLYLSHKDISVGSRGPINYSIAAIMLEKLLVQCVCNANVPNEPRGFYGGTIHRGSSEISVWQEPTA